MKLDVNLDEISLGVEMPWMKLDGTQIDRKTCGSEPRVAMITIGKPNDKPYQSFAEVGGFGFATSYTSNINGTRQ
jgi:hypothetical protein